MRIVQRWYRKSIRNKLTAVVLLAVVPSLFLASALAAMREAALQRASKEKELAGIAAALAASASEPLAAGGERQVANALKGIGAIPKITYVSVRDAAGRMVFQFGNGILVRSHDAGQPGGILNFSTFPVEADIRHGGTSIGRLLLIADISQVRDALLRALAAALITALAALLTGLAASWRMQRNVTRPIGALIKAMAHVREEKDFTHAVARTSQDETGQLVDAFNDMMREIRQRDAALAAHRSGLEQQVEERTRDLARAVEVAQAATRSKSDFLATMSHEIRTPMNGMLVMAELLAASELDARAQRRCEVILRSGQTLLSIINDILDLSKIEAGHLTLECIETAPAQVVDDILKLFSERAFSKGLQMAAYIAPGVPDRILADPVRLSQVLSNLVNNALKFTETGGVLVHVKADAAGGRLRFAVSDTGIGIPASKLSSIFDPFTQAEQSTTRRYGGTGIGLTICRKLVTAMGGSLSVESVEGAGSTFSFEAPFAIGAHAQRKEAPRLTLGTVVLALPAGPAREVLTLTARDAGLSSCAAADAATVATGSIRAVITTPDALAGLHALPALHGQKFILLSRLGDGACDRLLAAGEAHGLIETPFSSESARSVIGAVLSGRPAEPPARAISRPSSGEEALPFAGIRVLAADDSPLNREVLLEALRRLGAVVISVEDGAAAVATASAERFDLIFMDGSMPLMDGFDATRAIRAFEAENGRDPTPIVGLSAHVMGAIASRWQDCGMSDFITKPFTLAAIRACLERWTARPQQSAAPALMEVETRHEPPGLPPGAVLDVTVLQSIQEMQLPGDDLVARVASLYIAHAPELLEKLLGEPASSGGPAQLASAAHALKSLSRNVGALRVGDLCGAIEDAARDGHACAYLDGKDLRAAMAETLAALGAFTGLPSSDAPGAPASLSA